jgi:hypothetical protein
MVKPSQKPQTPKSDNGLNLSDLNGSISNAIVFPDSHFGLESGVWENAQRIADMLPVDFKVFGDLTEEDIAFSVEKAKGAELQAKNWAEQSAAISRYLKSLQKVRETQSTVSENVAGARVATAQIEKDLKTSLANLELEYRKIVGGSRSAIAGSQDDLEISLNRIASQYSESFTKKQAKLTNESKEKVPTAYEEQTTSLVDKFRKIRDERYSGASAGITQRIKAS